MYKCKLCVNMYKCTLCEYVQVYTLWLSMYKCTLSVFYQDIVWVLHWFVKLNVVVLFVTWLMQLYCVLLYYLVHSKH